MAFSGKEPGYGCFTASSASHSCSYSYRSKVDKKPDDRYKSENGTDAVGSVLFLFQSNVGFHNRYDSLSIPVSVSADLSAACGWAAFRPIPAGTFMNGGRTRPGGNDMRGHAQR